MDEEHLPSIERSETFEYCYYLSLKHNAEGNLIDYENNSLIIDYL